MAISISDYYNSIINRINSIPNSISINSQSDNSDNNTSKNSQADELDLNSYAPDLTGYLNYNAEGNYTNLPTLADFLNEGSNSGLTDLPGNSSSDSSEELPSLADYLNNDSSADQSDESSTDGLLNALAQQNTIYDNFLISNALNRLNSSDTQTQASGNSTKEDESTKQG